jgi:hypothetical protein
MSKRITTRWYIGAWVLAVLVGIATGLMARGAPAGSPPPGVTVASLVLVACGIVMFVMWIGALIKLGQQRAWGWFAFVLLLYVLTLGILGIVAMAVYAIAGPHDEGEVVIRPTAT